jgi:uncharacterized OB-fold protein
MEHLPYPPRVTPFTKPFWDGLREKRFSTTVCEDCRHMTFPPKPVCPNCWSAKVSWVPLSGNGVLRSFTEICVAPLAFAREVPYVVALIDLDEGVRCLSRIRASFDRLVPDIRVELAIREADPEFLFEFVPVS